MFGPCLPVKRVVWRTMYARVVVVGIGLFLVAGCGGGDGHKQASSASATTSPPAPSPSKTAAPPLTAADGTRLSSCHKGRCEVLISVGDRIHPPARLGVPVITVKAISSKGVTYLGNGPGIVLTFSGQRAGMTSYMNKVAINTVAIGDGKAVARFSPK
jgi:hypothetical protein